MLLAEVNKYLKNVLGGEYGGPSLSYDKDNDRFVLYDWCDAPVRTNVLATGKTIQELLDNYDKVA